MEEMAQILEANTADRFVQFEYEAQHFGFTPINLMNGVYNAVCDMYADALKAICEKLLNKYPDLMTKEKVSEARHAIGRKIDQHVNDVFDKLEIFLLVSVFTIPDECVLPNDRCQQVQLRKASEEKGDLEKKKHELKQRIIAIKYANSVLSKHLERGNSFENRLKENMDYQRIFSDLTGGTNMKDWLSYFSDTILTALKNEKS